MEAGLCDTAEHRVKEGSYPPDETPLESAWTFWYDKRTSDRKESEQYMESLRQLGSLNTIEGFYRHYSYLCRPTELPRDHNVLFFRKGYKPMWEEFPEGGCWIIRIKRKVAQNYVNRMWENLLMACIGEAFEMPDVVGCVLSTRVKDDVLSVWNTSNWNKDTRFRIGEKLKEVLDLDMNALIQYKDHMQSLQDGSTYRNAKNYMFAPSPTVTPVQNLLPTPKQQLLDDAIDEEMEFEDGLLPPAVVDLDGLLPPAAVDSEGFGLDPGSWPAPLATSQGGGTPQLSAAAAPWTPSGSAHGTPKLSAMAEPWEPRKPMPARGAAAPAAAGTPQLSAAAAPFEPTAAAPAAEPKRSWASIAAASSKP